MNIQFSRILLKRTNTSGVVPTIPLTNSHTDGTWRLTDIYDGELFLNTADNRLWCRAGNDIVELGTRTPWARGGSGGDGFGSIRNVMIDDTVTLDIRKQNFIYGKMQVDGLFQNSGEVVVQNGELLISGGELIGSGDVTIVTV